ncbi:MAG TPA: Smr/MutS family protein [Bacilli bacterium]|nr:Smr/MutS family protein [Bacilli bacterium]
MKKIYNDPFLTLYKILDLHGETRDSVKLLLNNFINESLLLKQKNIIVIHGIGRGILRREVHNLLKVNNKVIEYKLSNDNLGITIVKLGNKNS